MMKKNRKVQSTARNQSEGFSILELLVVMMIAAIAAALAIPGYNSITRSLRISGDARNLNAAINLAKLQASSNFTRSRVYADLAANTFHVDVWNKAGNSGAGCWQTVNDPSNSCGSSTSPVQNLSSGVTFGYANVGNAPPNTQSQLSQGTSATSCSVRNGHAYGVVTSTNCVLFNSRGLAIQPGNSSPITDADAIYITDNNMVYGLTVGATGVTQIWATTANGSGSWQHR
jgi:prepilin-type N-terminal cleavage/methylation domain-containing protein